MAFNINRNRPFKAFEQGEFSGRVSTETDNRWIFESKRRLGDDDIIYVWTDVQFNKNRFRSMSAPILLSEKQSVDFALNEIVNGDKPVVTTEIPPAIDPRNDNCEPALTIIRNRNACRGELIFEENFNGNELNATRWRYEVRMPLDIADAEFVLYDTNAEISNGLLKIEPRIWGNDSPNADIRSGNLNLDARCV